MVIFSFIFFLYFPLIFCSLKDIIITNGSSYLGRNYFYCSKSPNNSIHIFYRFENDYCHEIYDENEELFAKFYDRNNVKKLEFFDNDQEYLMLMSSLYYINEKNNSKIYFSSMDDFFILKNKDFIGIKIKYYLNNMELHYYSYPPDYDSETSFSLENVRNDNYEIIEISEAVLFFLTLNEGISENPIGVYVLDKTSMKLDKLKKLSAVTGFTLIDLKDNSDSFLYCSSTIYETLKCSMFQYKNKNLNIGNSFDAFSCTLWGGFQTLMKNYVILNDKIYILCGETTSIDLAVLQRKNDSFTISLNKRLKSYTFDYIIDKYFLIQHPRKGLILYYSKEEVMGIQMSIIKSYLEDSCSSFQLEVHALEKKEINFYDYISEGNSDTNISFMITEFDTEKLNISQNDSIIMPGNTIYNSSDSFYLISQDSDEPYIIKFKNTKNDYTCNAVIKVFYYQIKVVDKIYRCNISENKNITVVNNITFTDLNKSYDVHTQYNEDVNFKVEFVKEIKNEDDLIYRYANQYFKCDFTNKYIRKNINCIIPIYLYLFPIEFVRIEHKIYSRLSCSNDIFIGSITIEDPYLLEIIYASNLSDISTKIDKTYDPSERIEKFTIDMINYYHWFSSFANCDNECIDSGECCKEQLLSDWDVIAHKEFSYSLHKFLLKFGIYENFESLKEKILEELRNFLKDEKIDKIDEIIDLVIDEILSIYLSNFAILKSTKYKKYVISFSGLLSFNQILGQFLWCSMDKFEDDENIQVDAFFNFIFLLIKNDLFSKSIINEINNHKDYQIIFTGHSLGGAIATLASYYFSKHKLAENDLVLITFGQPRVGNENFARDFMKLANFGNNVYRIERNEDFFSMWPPVKPLNESKIVLQITKIFDIFDIIKNLVKEGKNIKSLVDIILATNPATLKIVLLEKILEILLEKIEDELENLKDELKKIIIDNILDLFSEVLAHGYCHIGGLYILDNESQKFYHCKDFYNEEISSPFCRNWEIEFGKLHTIWIPNMIKNHHYLTTEQIPRERCQENKRFYLINKYI